MELPIALQALQFAISGAAGLGLGLIYDLLRALRRRNRRLAVPLDLLFCLVALLLVLLLALCTAYLVDGSFNPFLYFRF